VQGNSVSARQAALAAYWTADRMKAAKPDTEMPVMKAAAQPQLAASVMTTVALAKPLGSREIRDGAAG